MKKIKKQIKLLNRTWNSTYSNRSELAAKVFQFSVLIKFYRLVTNTKEFDIR